MFGKSKKQPVKISPTERLEAQAWEAYDQGDFETSIQYFRAALELCPMSREIRLGYRDAITARNHEQKQKPRKKKTAPKPAPTKKRVTSSNQKKIKIQSGPSRQEPKDNFDLEDGFFDDEEFGFDISNLPTPRPAREKKYEDPDESIEHLTKIRRQNNPGFASTDGDDNRTVPGRRNKSRRSSQVMQSLSSMLHSPIDNDTELDAAMGTFAEEFKPPSERRRFSHRARKRFRSWTVAGIIAGLVVTGGILGMGALAHQTVSSFLAEVSLPSVQKTIEEQKTLPEDLNEALITASVYLTEREPEKAVKLLDEKWTAYPDYQDEIRPVFVSALRIEANYYLGQRKYPEAIRNYEQATVLEDADENNWIDYGRALAEYGRSIKVSQKSRSIALLEKSADAYNRALDIDEDNASALIGLGLVHTHLNNRKKAVESYNRVVATAPHSAEAVQAKQYLAQLVGNRS